MVSSQEVCINISIYILSFEKFFIIGSIGVPTYPLIFTNNLKANPTTAGIQRDTFRSECLKGSTTQGPEVCPPSFKRDHEDYYLSRLESPWNCDEEGSTLVSIPFVIVNAKDGKLLTMNLETGDVEAIKDATRGHQWTFKPLCGGGVELTNVDAGTSVSAWAYNPEERAFVDRESGLYAMSTKRNGLKWLAPRYLADQPNMPWARYQWEIRRA